MKILLQLALGVFLALLFIWFARRRGHRREMVVYGLGLVVAALFYVVFSTAGGAGLRWMMIEVAGVAVFTVVVVLGLKVSPWFLSIGWAMHILWDVLLHLVEPQAFVPHWYPVACISFDLTVAGYIAVRLRQWTK